MSENSKEFITEEGLAPRPPLKHLHPAEDIILADVEPGTALTVDRHNRIVGSGKKVTKEGIQDVRRDGKVNARMFNEWVPLGSSVLRSVAVEGEARDDQLVLGSDPRMKGPREPLEHSHKGSEVKLPGFKSNSLLGCNQGNIVDTSIPADRVVIRPQEDGVYGVTKDRSLTKLGTMAEANKDNFVLKTDASTSNARAALPHTHETKDIDLSTVGTENIVFDVKNRISNDKGVLITTNSFNVDTKVINFHNTKAIEFSRNDNKDYTLQFIDKGLLGIVPRNTNEKVTTIVDTGNTGLVIEKNTYTFNPGLVIEYGLKKGDLIKGIFRVNNLQVTDIRAKFTLDINGRKGDLGFYHIPGLAKNYPIYFCIPSPINTAVSTNITASVQLFPSTTEFDLSFLKEGKDFVLEGNSNNITFTFKSNKVTKDFINNNENVIFYNCNCYLVEAFSHSSQGLKVITTKQHEDKDIEDKLVIITTSDKINATLTYKKLEVVHTKKVRDDAELERSRYTVKDLTIDRDNTVTWNVGESPKGCKVQLKGKDIKFEVEGKCIPYKTYYLTFMGEGNIEFPDTFHLIYSFPKGAGRVVMKVVYNGEGEYYCDHRVI